VAALSLLVSAHSFAADLLTVADVEKVTGWTGLKFMPKAPEKGAGGELNFANADGRVALTVFVQPESMYAVWKKKFPGKAVSGLGDEAFAMGEKGFPPFIVFRKGKMAVWLQTLLFKAKDKYIMLDMEQISALAKVAASRL